MYAVLPFFISVNFAKFDLLLISIHLFSLQMLLFHQNLIIAIVFFTAYLIPPLSVCKEFKIPRSEEHTSELQSPYDLVCRLLLEKKYIIQSDNVELLIRVDFDLYSSYSAPGHLPFIDLVVYACLSLFPCFFSLKVIRIYSVVSTI